MGNIRPTYIKRIAAELVKHHGDKLTVNFDHNKKMVNELTDLKSKSMRNKIAGVMVRMKKKQARSPI